MQELLRCKFQSTVPVFHGVSTNGLCQLVKLTFWTWTVCIKHQNMINIFVNKSASLYSSTLCIVVYTSLFSTYPIHRSKARQPTTTTTGLHNSQSFLCGSATTKGESWSVKGGWSDPRQGAVLCWSLLVLGLTLFRYINTFHVGSEL